MKKILVLEDEKSIRDFVVLNLSRAGYDIVEAETGEQALELFDSTPDIDIAVLTIPKAGAVEVAERLVQNGIRAIWNFAHVDLNVPKGIQVENVHLSDSLMKLSYKINRYMQENDSNSGNTDKGKA